MNNSSLTIFYDSFCPLCVKEMLALAKRDKNSCLSFEDINADDFSQRFASINAQAANRVLHAKNADGELLLGLDVTAQAWRLVGNPLYCILRWPLIKPIADRVYIAFANNRYRVSYWLTGQARCERCQQIVSEHHPPKQRKN